MNNRQVAHLWANKAQMSGYGSNFWFSGGIIYSYGQHFPIARHVEGVILFTTQDYSVTTAKHKSYTQQAIGYQKVFYVDNVMARTKEEHKENYKDIKQRLVDTIQKAERARQNKGWLYSKAEQLVKDMNLYSKTFKLGYRQVTFDRDMAAKEIEKQRQAEARKKRKETKEAKKTLAAWREYRTDYYFPVIRISQILGSDFLRMKNGDTVETSRGAEFPAEHAKKAWQIIKKLDGKDWQSNGHTIKLGHFSIDRIVNGVIYAGCHKVTIKEAELLATSRGW